MEPSVARSNLGGTARDPGPEEADGTQKGRACATCAKLKIKCRWPANGSPLPSKSCTRCTRMRQPCHVPESYTRKKRGRSTRVSQLEEKIDGIVSMLAANKHVASNGMAPLTPESGDAARSRPRLAPGTPSDPRVSQGVPVRSSPNSGFSLNPQCSLTTEQADAYLDIYREEHMPKYPFVIIPKITGAQTLYDECPALFWMVMVAVIPQSVAMRLEIKNWFREYIAEHVVARQEKSLGLLQAILIQLAWGDFHFYLHMEATTILQIALALAMDLRIDRANDDLSTSTRSQLGDAWTMIHNGALIKPGPIHSPDERRAVLGLYHVTNLITLLFRRGVPFRWSRHLRNCCDILAEAQEYESDLFLVALVKMQHIVEGIYGVLPGTDFGDLGPSIYDAFIGMGIDNIRKELDSLIAQQPQAVKANKVFRVLADVYTMRLYEPAIQMRPVPFLGDGDPLQRSASLWECVQAASSTFADLKSLTPTEFHSLPSAITGTLAFSVVTFSRLMLHESSGDWQPSLVQKQIDFAGTLTQLADLADAADRWAENNARRRCIIEDNGTVIPKYSFKLRWIKRWYLLKVVHDPSAAAVAASVSAGPGHMVNGTAAPGVNPTPGAQFPVLEDLPDVQLDPDFWGEFFAPLMPEASSLDIAAAAMCSGQM